MLATVLVSVVIPTIGRPELLRAVRSVVQQDIATEALVVLDRPSLAEKVRETLGELNYRLILTAGSVGGAAARNVGIDGAQGDFVAFCDDDDWWESAKLERQLAALSNVLNPELAVATCPMFFHRRDGEVEVLPRRCYSPGESLADYLVTRRRVRFGDGAVQSSTLLAPTALVRAVRWDESLRLHEDWDFVLRLIAGGQCDLVSTHAASVHVQQGSVNSVSTDTDWQASQRWFVKHRSVLSRHAAADFVAAQILRRALATRDKDGVSYALRELAKSAPHPAALIVAAAGLFGR